MTHAAQFEGQRVGIMLSGGNIGLDRFVALVSGAEKVD
jgi:threonine dehydratase